MLRVRNGIGKGEDELLSPIKARIGLLDFERG